MQTVPASVRDAVREATAELDLAGIPEPAASAEGLMAELLDVGRGDLAFIKKPLNDEQTRQYRRWIQRRLDREPVQRILGYAYFRNLKLKLNEHTLIPRPDTESVVEAALESIDRRGGNCRVLDIGTGSGAIAISIAQERPHCEVHATDISEEALDIATANAESNGTAVHFHRADVVSGLELPGKVEVLVSNPPYVAVNQKERLAPEVRDWDPPTALYSGPDELLFYRRIFAERPPLLSDGADLVLEIGDEQAESVLELGRSYGFTPLGTRRDLAETLRVALLRWNHS